MLFQCEVHQRPFSGHVGGAAENVHDFATGDDFVEFVAWRPADDEGGLAAWLNLPSQGFLERFPFHPTPLADAGEASYAQPLARPLQRPLLPVGSIFANQVDRVKSHILSAIVDAP